MPDNMAVPQGIAAPFNQGGAVPRQTMIEDQPHMLAYIDPQEQSMLRQMGGSGQPGPGGVPAYARTDGPGSENFGSEARDFQDKLDRIEEEQNRNDADDRRQAEAALRAATEQRIAAQYPAADEIEVMNTAGYDKEPTSYPTANRNSYATPFSLEGGPLFSNTGGLEDPFDRNNRGMTNLGNPASDFLNAESAEGTFANTGGTSSIFDDGARDRMLNIFGSNTVNAGTISIPKFSSSNFTGDGGNLESSDVGYLGGEDYTAGGPDIDPVTARSNLAKRMRSLDDLALARSKLGFPERTDALSSSGAYVDSMGDRISDNRPLPDDVLFAAPKEFKNRSISPFDFNVSDPNTVGNYMNMSSGSSGLTSGLMTGDPFAPTKDSRGYMPYDPKDDFVRDDMSGFKTELQNSIAEFEKSQKALALANADMNTSRPTFAFQDENFGRDSDVTDFRDYSGLNDSNLSMYNDLDTPSTPLPSNQTPTSTGFGFDEDGEGFDSSVMSSNLSNADLNRFDFVERGRDLNRANEPYSSLGGLLGEATSDNIIDEIPYNASFDMEDAMGGKPTLADLAESGNVSAAAGLNFAELQKKARAAELERIIAEASMKPRPDESMYGAGMENQLNINRANTLAAFKKTKDDFEKAQVGYGVQGPPEGVTIPLPIDDRPDFDEEGEIFDSAGYNISKDYIRSLEREFTKLRDLGKFDQMTPNGEIRTGDTLARVAYDTGGIDKFEDFYKTDRYENTPQNDLESYAETLREYIDDANAGNSEGYYTDIDFDRDAEFRDSAGYNISRDYIKSLENQYETLSGKVSPFYLDRSLPDKVLEKYAGRLREAINDFKMDKPTPADFDPEGVVAGEKAFANNEEALVNDINSDLFSDSGMGGAIDDNSGVSEIGSGGVDFDSGGDFLGEFGGSGIDVSSMIDGGSGVTETDSDSGMGDALDEAGISDAVDDAEELLSKSTGNTKKVVDSIKVDINDNLYYKKLDDLSEGNYAFETKEELLKRLRAGIRNQGWVRDGVSFISNAHPVLALVDKLFIKLTQKDMKFQADLLDGDKRGYLKAGQTATAVRIQKGRHKGKYVGVVIMEGDKIIEYKGHAVMPNQFDNKDPLYDYILGEGFKYTGDDDNSAPNDPCPAGYVLSGGVCVPIQNVGEDDETTTEDDTTEDDTSEDETPTETLDEIIARIRQPPRVPTEPTETFNPITFANKGGAMGVDPLTSGAVTDSLASATQRFLSSLTG